eukprot:TRINITY_DN2116_c0_g1_i1.p1 TRINITY_DN2116_c0_g1~~TRINITY_DN2116_c0_g1_i1.p1  ORF type:complete len:230 (-),score=22.93 TRINITY_DN2116_c0_g1_i1:308-997(-)
MHAVLSHWPCSKYGHSAASGQTPVHVLSPSDKSRSFLIRVSCRRNRQVRQRNILYTRLPITFLSSYSGRFQCRVSSTQNDLNSSKEKFTEMERKKWEECSDCLMALDFSVEEVDRLLGKAFGWVHSPYWGEEKSQCLPDYGIVSACLDFLRSLGLSDDDLRKLLQKFPEVLGCNLEEEIKNNVSILEREWGIKGNSLRNVMLRNPRVLGYNVDCKGDCMAQCTRCWARF